MIRRGPETGSPGRTAAAPAPRSRTAFPLAFPRAKPRAIPSATGGDLVVTRWGARFRGRHLPCAIGGGGIGAKRGEGDNITPRGIWRLEGVFFRPDRIAPGPLALPLAPIGPADLWCDDPASPDYNRHLHARGLAASHETMRRADPMYDLVAVMDFNRPERVPHAGSAIFLHVWRRPRHPTAGCVAFRLPDLDFILRNWTARSRVVIR